CNPARSAISAKCPRAARTLAIQSCGACSAAPGRGCPVACGRLNCASSRPVSSIRMAFVAVVPTSMPIRLKVTCPTPFASCPTMGAPYSALGQQENNRPHPGCAVDFASGGFQVLFKSKLAVSGLVLAAAALAAGAAAAQDKVAIVTPYMAQPGTQFYVEAFEGVAADKGWDVNVIDTAGDVAAVISRIEDMVTQNVDAIVINVDPSQVTAGLQAAQAAGIPVFGMDAGADPLLVTNVTSNGYAMAAETATYVADRIGGA